MKRTTQSDTTAPLGSIWYKLKMEDLEHSLATGFQNGECHQFGATGERANACLFVSDHTGAGSAL